MRKRGNTHARTVGELKKLIENIPDNTVILSPADDHNFDRVGLSIGTALYGSHIWTEDHGEATPEKEFGKRYDVLIVG